MRPVRHSLVKIGIDRKGNCTRAKLAKNDGRNLGSGRCVLFEYLPRYLTPKRTSIIHTWIHIIYEARKRLTIGRKRRATSNLFPRRSRSSGDVDGAGDDDDRWPFLLDGVAGDHCGVGRFRSFVVVVVVDGDGGDGVVCRSASSYRRRRRLALPLACSHLRRTKRTRTRTRT